MPRPTFASMPAPSARKALVGTHRPDGPPPPPDDDPLLRQGLETQRQVHERLDRFDIRAAALAVGGLIRAAKAYIQNHRPWEQARLHDHAGFDRTIGSPWETATRIGDLLRIFTPDLAATALSKLERGIPGVLQPRLETRNG